MTLHLFEGPVKGPVCYCVPGGAASCATCREKRGRASEEAASLGRAIAAGQALIHSQSPATSNLRTDYIEELIRRANDQLAQSYRDLMFGNFDLGKPGADKTVIWHTDAKRAVTATEVRVGQLYQSARQEGKADKLRITLETLAVLNNPAIADKLELHGKMFDARVNAWLGTGEYKAKLESLTVGQMAALREGKWTAPELRSGEPELDGACRWMDCTGYYKDQHKGDAGCSCHLHPPCGWCTDTYLTCGECGDEPE